MSLEGAEAAMQVAKAIASASTASNKLREKKRKAGRGADGGGSPCVGGAVPSSRFRVRDLSAWRATQELYPVLAGPEPGAEPTA